MLRDDIKIRQQYEDSTIDENNKRVAIIRVTFNVGSFGPFTEKFPKADYSANVRDLRLNAFADEVRTS